MSLAGGRLPFSKRLLDLGFVLAAAPLWLPLLGLCALLVRVFLGPPVLFSQVRPGWKGRPFTLVKLRPMAHRYDQRGEALPDAERLTRFGKLLRASSLDELPELFNVLRGEMSLVGPRPLLMEYLPRYSVEQSRRHEALPGITGLAQVKGRNALPWEEVFYWDVWYVDHWSLGLDLKILGLTLWRVLGRQGVNEPGSATREKFGGE